MLYRQRIFISETLQIMSADFILLFHFLHIFLQGSFQSSEIGPFGLFSGILHISTY